VGGRDPLRRLVSRSGGRISGFDPNPFEGWKNFVTPVEATFRFVVGGFKVIVRYLIDTALLRRPVGVLEQ
jgi:hypothetical protein